jgi:integrase
MSKSRNIPAYVHHKPTGQARVRIKGKDFYLGKYGSPESHERYDELIAEHVIDAEPGSCKTLTAVLAAWWAECKRRYSKGKGKLGGAQNWRPIIRILREQHGEERAEDLGPVKLRKLLEAAAVEHGWSLGYTRMQLSRVKQIFKWAAAGELVTVTAYQRLDVVEIRHGRKTKAIPPVDDALVEQTLPHLTSMIADMVRLQRFTGMRPGELVMMQPDEVDRSGEIWIYVPDHHKTEHHGKDRTIYLGPKAQAILAPWLLKCSTEYVFPTRRSQHYTSDSYRQVIHRACKLHGLTKWSPNQVRKATATSVRKALDVESAASLLGHSSSVVTQDHYATHDKQRAIEAAKLLG